MATPGVVQEVVSVAAEHAERVDTDCAFPAEAVDALRKTGLLGLVLPREIGGMGSGPVEFTEVVAQLSAACGSTAMHLFDAHGGRCHGSRVASAGSAGSVGGHGFRKTTWHLGIQ